MGARGCVGSDGEKMKEEERRNLSADSEEWS